MDKKKLYGAFKIKTCLQTFWESENERNHLGNSGMAVYRREK
jgi:hypothetical protein